jgi:hypothetical protein
VDHRDSRGATKRNNTQYNKQPTEGTIFEFLGLFTSIKATKQIIGKETSHKAKIEAAKGKALP